MGRTVRVHIKQDGQWVPVGEVYVPTQVYDELRSRIPDDKSEIILGRVDLVKEEPPNGA